MTGLPEGVVSAEEFAAAADNDPYVERLRSAADVRVSREDRERARARYFAEDCPFTHCGDGAHIHCGGCVPDVEWLAAEFATVRAEERAECIEDCKAFYSCEGIAEKCAAAIRAREDK